MDSVELIVYLILENVIITGLREFKMSAVMAELSQCRFTASGIVRNSAWYG